MLADLHTHSTASDGALAPADLAARAAAAGVTVLALTDHDTLEGVRELMPLRVPGLQLVTGIELSVNWRNTSVHVVGLNIDVDNTELNAGIARQHAARAARAAIIAQRLEAAGFKDTLAGATRIADNDNVGRPHFARYLVESGQIRDEATAFRKHLGRGKPGDVKSGWAGLAEACGWILAAGGTPVLAHPARYKLTNMRLNELCTDFADAGGRAIEVLSGQQRPEQTLKLAKLANRHRMLASSGSDFHRPDQSWSETGAQGRLPPDCRPVWESW